MTDDGKINGHRPDWLLRGLDPAAGVGMAELPKHAEVAVAAMTGLRAEVPPSAHTAPLLGTEREGNAVIIDEAGLALTIGYLMLECRAVEIADAQGAWVEADFVGYDFETGFGLARARSQLGIAPVGLGSSSSIGEGEGVIVAGRGGRERAMLAKVVSRREFAGYWEYHLDDAIFTAPAYPNWSGAALIGAEGRVGAIGSLLVEDAVVGERPAQGNMFVPIDLLKPILDELVTEGRVQRPPRPWLGMFTAEAQRALVVTHVATGGPAARAGIEPGDVVLRVDAEPISGLPDLYRQIWRLGPAGVEVPLTIARGGAAVEFVVRSADRYDFFRTPRP
jgi:S1-C subfamily serine protease